LAKPEWGAKRLCQSCATKFYDFGRLPIVCPKCGSEFDPESVLKSRRRAPAKVAKAVKVTPVPVKQEEDLEVKDTDEEDIDLEDDAEDDDSVIEDTSDLGDDEDVPEVVVGDSDED